MKIDRVLLSTTGDPMYADGIQYVRQAWEKMGANVTVVQVGDIDGPDIPGVDIKFRSMKGVYDANLAKIMRVMIAELFPEDWCLISDADMIPLNYEYFRVESMHADENSILFYTSELEGEDAGKYPACYMLAKGSTFKQYVNPHGMKFERLVHYWSKGPKFSSNPLDHMTNPSVFPFSDESLYRKLFRHAPKICLTRHHQTRRLCRSRWFLFDQQELDRRGYIDCHMLRPFKDHIEELRPVFKSLDIEI